MQKQQGGRWWCGLAAEAYTNGKIKLIYDNTSMGVWVGEATHVFRLAPEHPAFAGATSTSNNGYESTHPQRQRAGEYAPLQAVQPQGSAPQQQPPQAMQPQAAMPQPPPPAMQTQPQQPMAAQQQPQQGAQVVCGRCFRPFGAPAGARVVACVFCGAHNQVPQPGPPPPQQPLVQPPAPPRPSLVDVIVPHGAMPGQQIKLNMPGVGWVAATVPPGTYPGQRFRVQAFPQQPAAVPRPMVEVQVPAGVMPGQQMRVAAPDGGWVAVTVPPGVLPGQRLRVALPAPPPAPPAAPMQQAPPMPLSPPPQPPPAGRAARAEPVAVDTTGNGMVDAVWIDENGDGRANVLKAARPIDTT